MLDNIICKNYLREKKTVFFQKISYISLPFGMVRKEKKIKLDLPKNYGVSQYIRKLPYIRNEDPNFKNSVIDIVNNRSDLKKFLLATSGYGKNIHENINAVVADGKFNQAVLRRALGKKVKEFLNRLYH